jgi:hypothetical protein
MSHRRNSIGQVIAGYFPKSEVARATYLPNIEMGERRGKLTKLRAGVRVMARVRAGLFSGGWG